VCPEFDCSQKKKIIIIISEENGVVELHCLHISAVLVGCSIYFLQDAYVPRAVSEFASVCTNLCKVGTMYVEYYISWGVAVYVYVSNMMQDKLMTQT
jgi:hypothetical protein